MQHLPPESPARSPVAFYTRPLIDFYYRRSSLFETLAALNTHRKSRRVFLDNLRHGLEGSAYESIGLDAFLKVAAERIVADDKTRLMSMLHADNTRAVIEYLADFGRYEALRQSIKGTTDLSLVEAGLFYHNAITRFSGSREKVYLDKQRHSYSISRTGQGTLIRLTTAEIYNASPSNNGNHLLKNREARGNIDSSDAAFFLFSAKMNIFETNFGKMTDTVHSMHSTMINYKRAQ